MPINYDKLDPEHALAAMISRDVLALEKDFKTILRKIQEYNDTISDDSIIKNFYEIVWESRSSSYASTYPTGRTITA
jgi:hypothetical protein